MSVPYLVRANDPTLREDAVARLVDELLAGEDRTLALEEYRVPDRRGDDDDSGADDLRGVVVAELLNAAQSPPFMTTRRVVVARDVQNLTADDAAPIVAYLAAPLDTTVLVFVAGGGRITKSLSDVLKSATTGGPDSERTSDVLAAAVHDAGMKLRPEAAKLVTSRLGDDAGRVGVFVDLLGATFGPGATLGADDVGPYLGEAGSVAPYVLTNRIEEGDVAGALQTLDRLLHAPSARDRKPMHPLQVTAILHSRYRKLLRLDDPGVVDPVGAAAALGTKGKPTFGDRKALEASRALGTAGLRRAIDLLYRADLDLKGASGLGESATLEVLVARLAGLARRSRGTLGVRATRATRGAVSR